MDTTPRLTPGTGPFVRVSGRFHRAVSADARAAVLAGSRVAGRYSRAGQPTLYLSASPDGVAAAMRAHQRPGDRPLVVVPLEVAADVVLDLRDATACAALGIDAADALAPWQEAVAAGQEPPSWTVRDRAEAAGARGLIDPSRTVPGLWHLVLFAPWEGCVWVADGAVP